MNTFAKAHRLRDISLIAACVLGSLASARSLELVWITADQVDRLTSEFGHKPHNSCQVSRNETGTMLFLIYPLRYGDTLVQVVSESGTRSNLVAGNRPVPDNDGSLICYMTYKAFKFARGDEIPITSGGRLGFCPSGDYFFHYDSTRRGAVLRTRWPDVPLFELPTNFWPHNIFVRTNDIYVFGHKDPPGPNRLGPAWGLVYASKDGFHLEKEIDLSAFHGVDDMDPSRGLLLVERGFEIFPTCGLYDLNTEEYRSLGRIRGDGLFLDKSFRHYLEEHWKMKFARPAAPEDAGSSGTSQHW